MYYIGARSKFAAQIASRLRGPVATRGFARWEITVNGVIFS